MNTIYTTTYKSPVGELLIGDFEGKLCLCDWKYRKMRERIDTRIQQSLLASYVNGETEITHQTIKQLEDYFNKHRISFDLPLEFAGSDFQKKVWKSLLEIPFGVTTTYLELAKNLKNLGAIRAVAAANGANAISIIVPCHRVIGADGKLVGYAGGLEAKKKLLLLEGINNTGNQLSLFN